MHCDDMYIMPSTPLTCCSMGAATVSATTCGVGAGIDGRDLDRGRRDLRILGDRQRDQTAMPPASVMTIDSTEAKIGRSMKKRENTVLSSIAALANGFRRIDQRRISLVAPRVDSADRATADSTSAEA